VDSGATQQEGNVIRISRVVVAIALVVALGVTQLAIGDGASENEVGVQMKLTPKKRDKKKMKPAQLFSGVTTSTTHAVPGQQNAEKVTVLYPKNMKYDFGAAEVCSAPLNGTTTEQAEAACPPGSNIGKGEAHANLGQGPDQVNDVVVTVFYGPGNQQVRLHAYSASLGAGLTQVVNANLQNSSGGLAKQAGLSKRAALQFGPALIVNDAPDLGGDQFMLTLFNATIPKNTGAVLAKCKSKTDASENITIYDDGSKDTATTTAKCKQKKKK
jgi:hypothetical protein